MNFDPGFSYGVRSHALVRDPLANSWPHWLPVEFLMMATALAALLATPLILFVDQPAAIAIRAYADTAFVAFFRVATHAGHSAIWYGLAAISFVGALSAARQTADQIERWTWRRRARSFLYMVMSMAVSGTLVNAFKLGFGRYRPRFLFDDGIAGFAPFALTLDDCAFPSGHTQSIVAAMTALGFIFPRSLPFLLIIAVVVACSRFLTTVHFISDVVAGAYIGLAVAVAMKCYFERSGLRLAWSAPAPAAVLNRPLPSTY